MVHTLLNFAAEESLEIVEAQVWQGDAAKAAMVAVAMAVAAISLGLIGSNYMKALGRNPEAGKAASQIIIVAAMVEVTALLTLVSVFLI